MDSVNSTIPVDSQNSMISMNAGALLYGIPLNSLHFQPAQGYPEVNWSDFRNRKESRQKVRNSEIGWIWEAEPIV